MPWPNWQQAASLTVVMLLLAAAAKRWGNRRGPSVAAGATEIALVSFLYMLWRLARVLPLVQDEGAVERGHQVWRFQQWLHLPSELAIERWTLHHRWLAEFAVSFYATAHVPALLGFLVWLYVRHKPDYPRWRNALVITTGFCLFIRFVRVAPPRLLPDLGFVDMSNVLHKSVYGPVGTGVSDQFAAMPSIHIAWAAIVCFGVLQASPSRWRIIGPVHLALTFFAVVATANHWWMDGIVAIGLMVIALGLDWAARRLRAAHRRMPVPAIEAGVEPAPETVLEPAAAEPAVAAPVLTD